jgi:CBS domain-containing protein
MLYRSDAESLNAEAIMTQKDLVASDVMTTRIATVAPSVNVRLAAELMLKRNVSALLVLDSKKRLIGVCSEGDLVHRAELGSRKKGSWWLNLVTRDRDMARDYARAHGRRVSDAMSRNVVGVDPKTPLATVVALMERHRIKRVPVLDEGRVVGLVSRADILAAFVQTAKSATTKKALDNVAALDAIRKAMGKESWAGATLVSVTVNAGVARFSGIVATGAQRDALRALAENVPGIRHADLAALKVNKS